MQLTIYRGTKEIGGSCVEVRTASTRIILDVGLPLVNPDREPFDPRIIQGKSNEDLTAAKVLPRVPGLFGDGSPPDAILLSHSHLDHTGLLHLTRPDIPIFATSGTSKMMLAGAVFSRQRELDRARQQKVTAKQTFTIGDMTITPFAVDHSTFGSVAYLIEAEGKTLFYSGDLRTHGRKPGMVRELVAELRPRNIDVLLIEGTHFGSNRGKGITEFELEEKIVGHVRSAPGLVLACFSPVDVDRLVTWYRASQRSGRTFVADAYAAFVMHLAASETSIPRPTGAAGIQVYFNRAFDARQLNTIRNLFESDRISLGQILADPARYVMVFRPTMTEFDFGSVLPIGSRCLYSYWEGYLKKPDWIQLQDHLKKTGGDFIPAHTSGHIFVEDHLDLVRAINPKWVVPIHTFEPGGFRRHFANVELLNDAEPYLIP